MVMSGLNDGECLICGEVDCFIQEIQHFPALSTVSSYINSAEIAIAIPGSRKR
jgi:hypothetical protein